MKAALKAAGAAVKRLGAKAVDFYRRYPARGTSYILAAVVAVGGALGIGVDQASVKSILEVALPILLSGEAIHHQVTPAR